LKSSQSGAKGFARVLASHQAGDLALARRGYLEILRASPRHFDAKHLLGVVAHQQGEHEQAVKLIREALLLSPRIASAHNNLGSALLALGRHEEAKTSFSKALGLEPGYIEARYNLGNALFALRELEPAVEVFGAVTQALPDHFEAWNNLGSALLDLNRLQEALEALNHAVLINPTYAAALFNRGNVHSASGAHSEALNDFDLALAINGEQVETWRAKGDVLRKGLRNYQAAIDAYDRGLHFQPEHLNTLIGKGQAHYLLKQLEPAIDCYERALTSTPQDMHLLGNLLLARLHLCRWEELPALLDGLLRAHPYLNEHINPFGLLSLTDSPSLQLADSTRFQNTHSATVAHCSRPEPRWHDGRIRVGYVSEDFMDHPVGRQIVQLLECHDRTRYEIFAISLGPETHDAVQERIRCAVEHFIAVGDQSDADISLLMRELQLDVAIDLNGATGNIRNGMFARGCAPIQASYLGYAGSSGAEFFDYLIADRIVVPPRGPTTASNWSTCPTQ
jgi:protein O-GlcNAc transferase